MPIGVQEKIYHECEVLILKAVHRVQFGITQQSLVMTKCNPRDRFFDQYLTLRINSNSLTLNEADGATMSNTASVFKMAVYF